MCRKQARAALMPRLVPTPILTLPLTPRFEVCINRKTTTSIEASGEDESEPDTLVSPPASIAKRTLVLARRYR